MFLKGFAVLKAGLFAALLVPGLSSVNLPMPESWVCSSPLALQPG